MIKNSPKFVVFPKRNVVSDRATGIDWEKATAEGKRTTEIEPGETKMPRFILIKAKFYSFLINCVRQMRINIQ